jgi:hypothetical protein
MKLRGLRGIPLFLAVSASVVLACISVLLMAGEYHSVRSNLDALDREYQGWEACRQMRPAYYEDNKEAVSSCLKSLEETRDNFWLKLPKVQLAGLFIIVGLGSAAGGYVAIWVLVLLIGGCFQKFVRWLSLRSPPKPKMPLDSQSEIQPSISTEC